MKCVSTISIKTKEGRVHVPCGTCIHCLTKKQQDWAFRLNQEKKIARSSYFVTLTYDGVHIPINEGHNQDGEVIYFTELNKRDLQLFMKRLRKQNEKDISDYQKIKPVNPTLLNTLKIRYYAVGEYGSQTKRPHYHLILFNVNPKTITEIKNIWGKGMVDIGEVNDRSITYITKYVINYRNIYYGQRQKPFSTMSKQPGIGHNYLLDNSKWHTDNKYFHAINSSGTKIGLPDYYKNKLFSKIEKENHKLKNEQKLIDKEIKDDIRLEKLGYNPYTERRDASERKRLKAIKNQKKSTL